MDKPGIGTVNMDRADNRGPSIADANKVNNSGIGTTDIDETDNSSTGIKGATSSNGNDNSKIRCPKFINFSINNITSYGYSIQLTTKMIKAY